MDSIYAEKDKYLSMQYADSSDDDEKEHKIPVYKAFKLGRQKTTKTSTTLHRSKSCRDMSHMNDVLPTIVDILGADDFNTPKPCLRIEPTSPKTALILDGDIKVPGIINQYLRQYQQSGVLFLYQHFKEGTGCILADDMGLGKTIQVISFFAAVLRKTGYKKDIEEKTGDSNLVFLVVAPTSVLYNWLDEINTWGYFKIGKFHRKSKDDVIDSVREGKLEVVLTTHETMRIYIDTLCGIKWSAVVFDEAHRIKEPSALVTKAAKRLESRCRFGLTGTPLQNNFKEFWCLLDWANPNCLGSLEEFDQKFSQPIAFGQRYSANKRELATARKKQQELAMLHKRWLIRRTKDMIQDQLPMKVEKIVFCSLSNLQVSIYEAVLKLPKVRLLLGFVDACECGSGLKNIQCCVRDFVKEKEMFKHIQLLLKISNHASLLLPHHHQSEEQKKLSKQLCEKMFKDFPLLEDLYKKQNFAKMSDPAFCGKMTVLQKLLNVLQQEEDKILLFSHSTTLLDILEAYVISRGMIYRRLDGKTPAEERTNIMKEFNGDPSISICLLSTTAGSLGLNFTGANFVIIFDPMWNPTHDQQAQDRAYRIGQQRDVNVYRFISVGTIEENIYMRQIYKQQLANTAIETSTERRYFTGVAGDKRYHGELFGLSNMFKFSKTHNSSFAQDTFNKVKQIQNGVVVAKYKELKAQEVIKTDDKTDLFDTSEYELQASQCIDDDDVTDQENDALLNLPLVCDDLTPSLNNGDHNRTAVKTKQLGASYDKVLENCGVSFVHSTKSVVGSSKKEEQLSNRAIHDVFWDGVHSQQLANDEQDIDESGESQDILCTNSKQSSSHETKEETPLVVKHNVISSSRIFERIGDIMFIIGSTPPGVQKTQFLEMALQQGFNSATDFAEHIVNSGSGEWTKMLEKFYVEKERSVKLVSSFNQIYCDKNQQRRKDVTNFRLTVKRKPSRKFECGTGNKKLKKRNAFKLSTKVVLNSLFDGSSTDDISECDSNDERQTNDAKITTASTPRVRSFCVRGGKLKKRDKVVKKDIKIHQLNNYTDTELYASNSTGSRQGPQEPITVIAESQEQKNADTLENLGLSKTLKYPENNVHNAPAEINTHSPSILDELLSTPPNLEELSKGHCSTSSNPSIGNEHNRHSFTKLCSNTKSLSSSPSDCYSTTAVMETFDSSISGSYNSSKCKEVDKKVTGNVSVLDELLDSNISPNNLSAVARIERPALYHSVLDELMA